MNAHFKYSICLIITLFFLCCKSKEDCNNYDHFFNDHKNSIKFISINEIFEQVDFDDLKDKYDFNKCGGNKVYFKTNFLKFDNIKLNFRLPKLCPGIRDSRNRFKIWINKDDTIYCNKIDREISIFEIHRFVKNYLEFNSDDNEIIFPFVLNDRIDLVSSIIREIKLGYIEYLDKISADKYNKLYCDLNAKELEKINLTFDLQVLLNIKRKTSSIQSIPDIENIEAPLDKR